MLKILIFFFMTTILYSQKLESRSSEKSQPHVDLLPESSPEGNYSKSLKRNLQKLETEIAEKVNELEKLHKGIPEKKDEFNSKIFIPEEIPNSIYISNKENVSSREVELYFQSEKLNEVKITTKKMDMENDLYSTIKIITLNPYNLDSLKIKYLRFDSKTNLKPKMMHYKEMPIQVKIITLKFIREILKTNVFKFVAIIQKEETEKIIRGKEQINEF